MSASQPFRLGLIGVAGIAHAHVKHLRAAQIEGVEVAAAADIKPEPLRKFCQEYNVPEGYTDYREMLAKARLDAVSVCTPNFLHLQPTLDALRAGCHVLVEKPMALNARECARMNAAAAAAKRHLVVGFQHRFSGAARFLREQIAAGVLGDIVYVRVQALRRRGIPSWGTFGRKDLQGGGGMIDIGVHMLEVAHVLMGRPRPVACNGATYTYLGNQQPAALCNWGPWDHTNYTVEDLATGWVRFGDGATLSIESSFAAHIEKDVWTLQLMGTKGGAIYDPVTLFTDQNGYMVDVKPNYLGKFDPFTEKMRHFIAVARDGAPNESSGADGQAVQQIVDGLYRSAELGREVRLK